MTENRTNKDATNAATVRPSLRWAGLLAAALLIVFAALPLARSADQEPSAGPKNVIMMISDGCGYNHVDAANLYQSGRTGVAIYESFPFNAAMTTYPADGRYDPDKAWSDFDYVKKGPTDSAAAATAMSTGVKTYPGAIGVDMEREPVTHLTEVAEELRKATGVVSSVQFSHATPAGFVAHNEARGHYKQIAREMIQKSKVDVIMGCGHPEFGPDGQRAEKPNYRYVGGKELWQTLQAGRAGGEVDADHNGKKDDAWSLVEERADFRKLGSGKTPKRVFGLPRGGSTLQYGRSGKDADEPFEAPRVETVPTLAEMTSAALNVLDDDPDGMFLMVEGGAVDWASHSNDSARMIEEQIRFNRAVDRVVSWVEENSSWDETLLIVTADHECGYLCPAPEGENDTPWAYEEVQNRSTGEVPGLSWHSGGHTNSLVPIYARGPAVDALRKCLNAIDPQFGPYLDNTDLPTVIRQAWKGK